MKVSVTLENPQPGHSQTNITWPTSSCTSINGAAKVDKSLRSLNKLVNKSETWLRPLKSALVPLAVSHTMT